MKTISTRLIIIVALLLSLSYCGNKGDLYMPDKTKDNKTTESNNSKK